MIAMLSLCFYVALPSQPYSDEVSLAQLSGTRIDSNWFRYINSRFGVAIDIPTKGYRYEVPVNGSGLTLTSDNGAVVITVYAHFVAGIFERADDDVQKSISQIFDDKVAQSIQENGTVTYSVKKDDFYVISGNFGNNTYYERLTISSKCPDIFNA